MYAVILYEKGHVTPFIYREFVTYSLAYDYFNKWLRRKYFMLGFDIVLYSIDDWYYTILDEYVCA